MIRLICVGVKLGSIFGNHIMSIRRTTILLSILSLFHVSWNMILYPNRKDTISCHFSVAHKIYNVEVADAALINTYNSLAVSLRSNPNMQNRWYFYGVYRFASVLKTSAVSVCKPCGSIKKVTQFRPSNSWSQEFYSPGINPLLSPSKLRTYR